MKDHICPTCGHLGIRRVYEVPRPQTYSYVTDEDVRWWIARHAARGVSRKSETVRYNIELGKRIGTYSPNGIHRWKKTA